MGKRNSNRKDADVLELTAKLLEGGWTKDAAARDRKDKIVAFDNPNATKFSLTGALYRAAHDLKLGNAELVKTLRFLCSLTDQDSLSRFNKEATAVEVLIEFCHSASTKLRLMAVQEDLKKKHSDHDGEE